MSKVGIVYQIKCNETGEVYIGSSENSLEGRMYFHEHNSNCCVSCVIIKRGDYTESVVKEIEFDDPADLLWEERWSIEACDKAINIRVPILTDRERQDIVNKATAKWRLTEHGAEYVKSYSYEYYHKYRDTLLQKNKEYDQTEKGKESKARRGKKYRNGPKREELLAKKREDNKANYDPEKSKAYREGEKREELLEKKRAQYQKDKENGKCDSIQCDCGGTYTFVSKARHFKTEKHLDFINSQ